MPRAAARKRPAPADKREAIVAAALELFAERSFNGTPMPLVAERAGVGAGTIYRYFESKEALGNAVFRECKLAAQRELLERSRRGRSTREQFAALWRGLFEFYSEYPAAFRFLETHNHTSYLDAASKAAGDAVFASIVEFVRRGQLAGAIRQAPPAVLIAMAFGAFIGLVKEAEMGRFGLDARVVSEAEPLVWDMLSPESPTSRQRRARGSVGRAARRA